jgi:5-carboxymethyl-2-hydroxymuconate isomerase
MPHCIIEYSRELEKFVEPKKMITAVYQGALESGLFNDEDIKTRSIAYDNYQSGSIPKAFVHVVAKIFSGRNLEQKKTVTNLILSQLKRLDFPSTLLTVEVIEIEKESYAKEGIHR